MHPSELPVLYSSLTMTEAVLKPHPCGNALTVHWSMLMCDHAVHVHAEQVTAVPMPSMAGVARWLVAVCVSQATTLLCN